jgi:hypothetical protein
LGCWQQVFFYVYCIGVYREIQRSSTRTAKTTPAVQRVKWV